MLLHEPSPSSSHGSRHQSFSRHNSPTPIGLDMSAAMPSHSRSRFGSPAPAAQHTRQQASPALSFSPPAVPGRFQSLSRSTSSNTFAPKFILRGGNDDKATSIEGESNFDGKRYVWVKDPERAFKQGWVVEDLPDDKILVQFEEGSQAEYYAKDTDPVNPAKFDKADDMAELTHLNEASVIHNLHTRYQADLIYTYSGLFLVAINPYCPLPIYGNDYVRMYKGQAREETRPHIFAVSDIAFRRLVDQGKNQSILVTGESGAGKTENTKKVIQYLAAVATADGETQLAARSQAKQMSNLEQQILRANPILESFGNAQTVRNHNSSRFGKFIKIQFTRSGRIAGAFIDWYLLEKSRVVKVGPRERSYHIFYQLLEGADRQMRDKLLLSSLETGDFSYLRGGNDFIGGVSDRDEWNSLVEAFHIMGFSSQAQMSIFKTVAAILHLGNVSAKQESRAGDQAALTPEAKASLHNACQLLGVQTEPFTQGLLHPKVKAGREWVEKVQNAEQVRLALDALAKGIYERGFGDLVSRINERLDRGGLASDENHFIGVLDIAGFEIFETNSFEQLCINYTNEKLQQFFNHYMFVLEQEEYRREQIEWDHMNFGEDLQPTIDLIELSNPIGIFSCLDEDSVMPKATDHSFTEKLHTLWEKKSPKYTPARPRQGFILTHYAAEVEYSTEGWLEKNKDPLNDNLTRLLATSKDDHVANLFSDCVDEGDETYSPRSRVKRGLFRTVAQRHKEQLSSLMRQLHSTQPHFVRCILPNHNKKPKQFQAPLVLDQLRCNGVLEGIRIARNGFPNRLTFAEFRSRYEILCLNMPKGYLDGQEAVRIMIDRLELDRSEFRIGITKVFLRAGVLARLEEDRHSLIRDIVTRFQSVARGFIQRRQAYKKLFRAEATRVIQRNMNAYLDLQTSAWWKLFVQMRPMLGATRTASEVKRRDEKIEHLQAKIEQDVLERQRVEEERRKAELEVLKAQQTLEAERALMLDKEEISKRLRVRETELSEEVTELRRQLQESADDIASVEADLDSVKTQKDEMSAEVKIRREQIVKAAGIITNNEKEVRDLTRKNEQLVADLTTARGVNDALQTRIGEKDEQLANAAAQDTSKVDDLNQQIRSLHSQIGVKDRKIHEAETNLKKFQQDKNTKTSALETQLQSLRDQLAQKDRQANECEEKVKKLQETLAEQLAQCRDGYESQLRRLRADLDAQEQHLEGVEAEAYKVDARAQEADAQLSAANKELAELRQQKDNLDADHNKALFDNDNLRERAAQHANTNREKDEELKRLQEQLKQKDTEISKVNREKETLSKERDEAVQRHDALQVDQAAIGDNWRAMEKDALEARRRLEAILPFFQTHFPNTNPDAGAGADGNGKSKDKDKGKGNGR